MNLEIVRDTQSHTSKVKVMECIGILTRARDIVQTGWCRYDGVQKSKVGEVDRYCALGALKYACGGDPDKWESLEYNDVYFEVCKEVSKDIPKDYTSIYLKNLEDETESIKPIPLFSLGFDEVVGLLWQYNDIQPSSEAIVKLFNRTIDRLKVEV